MCGSQRTALKSWFSPTAMWVLVTELRSPLSGNRSYPLTIYLTGSRGSLLSLSFCFLTYTRKMKEGCVTGCHRMSELPWRSPNRKTWEHYFKGKNLATVPESQAQTLQGFNDAPQRRHLLFSTHLWAPVHPANEPWPSLQPSV